MHIGFAGWNSLETSRNIHSVLEIGGLLLFAALVLFEVLAHRRTKREHLFKILALISFALAIACEIVAYPYSRRIDTLSDMEKESLRKEVTDLRTQVKPTFAQRLRVFLDSVDKRIVPELAKRGQSFTVDGMVESSKASQLRALCADPESRKYITLVRSTQRMAMALTDTGVQTSPIAFILSTNLLTPNGR